jgi:RNA polymerase sigma-70 factor (ECF subfamily)
MRTLSVAERGRRLHHPTAEVDEQLVSLVAEPSPVEPVPGAAAGIGADAGRPGDDLDDRALVERARSSSDDFAVLYRRHVDAIHRYAYRVSGSREVAEEVTSATFERAWRALPDFEWRGGGFEPWLFAISAAEIAGFYRREQRSARPRAQMALRELALGQGEETDDPARVEERMRVVREAMATLRPRYREAISLRFLSGLSHQQAAKAMDCSAPAMAVVVHRALKALRRAIAAQEPGQGDFDAPQ